MVSWNRTDSEQLSRPVFIGSRLSHCNHNSPEFPPKITAADLSENYLQT